MYDCGKPAAQVREAIKKRGLGYGNLPTQSITLLHIFFVYQSYGILGEKGGGEGRGGPPRGGGALLVSITNGNLPCCLSPALLGKIQGQDVLD